MVAVGAATASSSTVTGRGPWAMLLSVTAATLSSGSTDSTDPLTAWPSNAVQQRVHNSTIDEQICRSVPPQRRHSGITAALQWYHNGIAAVPYYQHPLVKIS